MSKDITLTKKFGNENSYDIKNDEELIIKYINEIKNEETRFKAIKNLFKYIEKNKKLAIYLWYSTGTIAIFLQEIIQIYPYLGLKKISQEKIEQVNCIIQFFQVIALHPQTRKPFVESKILEFLYPFLSVNNKFEKSRIFSLGVVAALVKIDNSYVINFLIESMIFPKLMKILHNGEELSRKVVCFIIEMVIHNRIGFNYIVEYKHRLSTIIQFLDHQSKLKTSQIAKNYILRIYLKLIENKEAKNMLKNEIYPKIKDKNFYESLDSKNKVKLLKLIKAFEEDNIHRNEKMRIIQKNEQIENKNNSDNNLNKIDFNKHFENVNYDKRNQIIFQPILANSKSSEEDYNEKNYNNNDGSINEND
jgi:CCR4-NOT transcription complex subunit 9